MVGFKQKIFDWTKLNSSSDWAVKGLEGVWLDVLGVPGYKIFAVPVNGGVVEAKLCPK